MLRRCCEACRAGLGALRQPRCSAVVARLTRAPTRRASESDVLALAAARLAAPAADELANDAVQTAADGSTPPRRGALLAAEAAPAVATPQAHEPLAPLACEPPAPADYGALASALRGLHQLGALLRRQWLLKARAREGATFMPR
jgi:hypothetical protein